jgi:hypothetical protein
MMLGAIYKIKSQNIVNLITTGKSWKYIFPDNEENEYLASEK